MRKRFQCKTKVSGLGRADGDGCWKLELPPRRAGGPSACTLHPTPCTPHPTPHTLHPSSHTPHPAPQYCCQAPGPRGCPGCTRCCRDRGREAWSHRPAQALAMSSQLRLTSRAPKTMLNAAQTGLLLLAGHGQPYHTATVSLRAGPSCARGCKQAPSPPRSGLHQDLLSLLPRPQLPACLH